MSRIISPFLLLFFHFSISFCFHCLPPYSQYLRHISDPLSAEDYDTKLQRGGSIDNSQEGLDFNPRSRSSSQSQILTGETSSPFRTPLRISTSTADRGTKTVFMRSRLILKSILLFSHFYLLFIYLPFLP